MHVLMAVLIVALGFVLAGLALAGWIAASAIHIGWASFSENQAQLAAGCILAGVAVGGLVGFAGHVLHGHGDGH
jgi:hypothetical protein